MKKMFLFLLACASLITQAGQVEQLLGLLKEINAPSDTSKAKQMKLAHDFNTLKEVKIPGTKAFRYVNGGATKNVSFKFEQKRFKKICSIGPIEIFQVPVASQKGALCGIHALKNALYMVMALRSEKPEEYLQLMGPQIKYAGAEDYENTNPLMKFWFDNLGGRGELQDIASSVIEESILKNSIIKGRPNLEPLLPQDYIQEFKGLQFFILPLDYMTHLNDNKYTTEKTVDFCLDIATNDNGQWGFTINVSEKGGHWFSLVLEKVEGVQRWYFMNSTKDIDENTIDQLIRSVNLPIEQLQQKKNNIILEPLKIKLEEDVDKALAILEHYNDKFIYIYKGYVVVPKKGREKTIEGSLKAINITPVDYQTVIKDLVRGRDSPHQKLFEEKLPGKTISFWSLKDGKKLFGFIETDDHQSMNKNERVSFVYDQSEFRGERLDRSGGIINYQFKENLSDFVNYILIRLEGAARHVDGDKKLHQGVKNEILALVSSKIGRLVKILENQPNLLKEAYKKSILDRIGLIVSILGR